MVVMQSCGTITLSDKDAGHRILVSLCHSATVCVLAVVQVGFLCALTCQFGNTGNGFTFLFGVLYLLQHDFRNQRILVEIVIHLCFEKSRLHIFTLTPGDMGGEPDWVLVCPSNWVSTLMAMAVQYRCGCRHIWFLLYKSTAVANNFSRTSARSTLCGMPAV